MNCNIFFNSIKLGIFAIAIAPFIVDKGFYFPFVGLKGIYFMAVAETVFFVWLFLVLRWKKYCLDIKNPVTASVFVFVAVSFLSTLFGPNFSTSFWSDFERMAGVLMLFHLAAVFAVASSVLGKREWRQFFFASVIAASIVGMEALLNQDLAAHAGGFIGNDSFLGSYLIFNVFIALYLVFSQKGQDSRWLKISAVAAFVVLSFCLLFEGTQSWASIVGRNPQIPESGLLRDIIDSGARAAKISFIGGLVLLGTLWLAFRKNTILKNIGRLAGVVFVSGAVLLIIFSTQPGSAVYRAMENRFSEGTVRGRIVVWEIAWKGFLDRPLLGWGPENFDLAFVRHYDPCLGANECAGYIWYDRAHNIVFDTLATTGIIGLMSYLALFGAALYVLWKKYFAGAIGFAEAGVFTALLAAYFVQNLTVFDMITSLMMFFLVLGFIASLDSTEEKREERRYQPLPFWKTGAIVLAFVICFQNFVIGPYNADRNVILAAQSLFGSQQRLDLYKKTFASSPMGEFQIRLFFAQKWLEAVQGGAIGKLTAEQINREFSFLTGELEKSRSQVSSDFKSRLMLGQLYNAWTLYDPSKLSLADKALSEAKSLAPRNQQAYFNLAQTRLYQRDIAGALELAQQAYDLYPANAQAKTVLDQIKEIQNKVDGGK